MTNVPEFDDNPGRIAHDEFQPTRDEVDTAGVYRAIPGVTSDATDPPSGPFFPVGTRVTDCLSHRGRSGTVYATNLTRTERGEIVRTATVDMDGEGAEDCPACRPDRQCRKHRAVTKQLAEGGILMESLHAPERQTSMTCFLFPERKRGAWRRWGWLRYVP